MDQSKKTMRHFYCRDVLWETFEQMANDFDCSIDYLVNEAMRFYARSKNYQAGTVPPTSPPPSGGGASGGGGGNGAAQTTHRPRPPMPPPPASSAGTSMRPQLSPAPPARRATASAMGSAAMPALAPAAASRAPDPGLGPTLFLLFNNQRISIDKDQFIIGRGSKSSDLPIKDGNISRKHAAVIRRNGMFYIKDLGSTNGIDYKGMRIDNKRIDEGDVFHLCDYELRFTYR